MQLEITQNVPREVLTNYPVTRKDKQWFLLWQLHPFITDFTHGHSQGVHPSMDSDTPASQSSNWWLAQWALGRIQAKYLNRLIREEFDKSMTHFYVLIISNCSRADSMCYDCTCSGHQQAQVNEYKVMRFCSRCLWSLMIFVTILIDQMPSHHYTIFCSSCTCEHDLLDQCWELGHRQFR